MSKLLQEIEATGKVAEIYGEIKEAFGGLIPDFFKALAAKDVEWLDMIWEREKKIMLNDTAIDRKHKELIAMATCINNNTEYCAKAHETLARMFGAIDAEVNDAKKIVELFSSFGKIMTGLDVPMDITPAMHENK